MLMKRKEKALMQKAQHLMRFPARRYQLLSFLVITLYLESFSKSKSD